MRNKSKLLSYALRHNPQEFGLEISSGGWVLIDQVLIGCKLTKEELDTIVATDNKKRYSYDDNGNIRANQGHSIDIDMQFEKKMPPRVLYHGTAERFFDSIMEHGIKSMSRQYVHLSADVETAKKVGSRHGRPIIIKIDAGDMFLDGIDFYCAENGVWLTKFVDPKYIFKGE